MSQSVDTEMYLNILEVISDLMTPSNELDVVNRDKLACVTQWLHQRLREDFLANQKRTINIQPKP